MTDSAACADLRDYEAAGILDARWLSGAPELALALALSSGRVQLVLVRAWDEQCSLEDQGAVMMPSSAMVLSVDVRETEAACMAASTSAGEVAVMKVAMCTVVRTYDARCSKNHLAFTEDTPPSAVRCGWALPSTQPCA